VEVRLGGVAGISDEGDHLPPLHAVADLHAERAGPEVRVEGVVPATDVDDDVVATHRLEGNRHGARVDAGHVLGQAVLRGHHAAVGHSQRVVPLGVVVGVVRRITVVRAGRIIHLDPVDGEALGNVRRSVDGDHGAPVAG